MPEYFLAVINVRKPHIDNVYKDDEVSTEVCGLKRVCPGVSTWASQSFDKIAVKKKPLLVFTKEH
jgi:hypothetical protein